MEIRANKIKSYRVGASTLRGEFLFSREPVCTPSPTFEDIELDVFIPDDSVTLPPIFPQKPTPTYTPTETFTYSPTPTDTPTLTPTSTPTPTDTFTYTFTNTTPPPPPTPTPTGTAIIYMDPYTDTGSCYHCCEEAPVPGSNPTETFHPTFINWYRFYRWDVSMQEYYLADWGNFTDDCCANAWYKYWAYNNAGEKEPRDFSNEVCIYTSYEKYKDLHCRHADGTKFEWSGFPPEGVCGTKNTNLPETKYYAPGGPGDGGEWPAKDESFFCDHTYVKVIEECQETNFFGHYKWDAFKRPCCKRPSWSVVIPKVGKQWPSSVQYYLKGAFGGWEARTGAECICGYPASAVPDPDEVIVGSPTNPWNCNQAYWPALG